MDTQRLNKVVADPYAVAHKYYQILSVLNDLYLADGEIQLVAFAAIKGNISDLSIREEYCDRYRTTIATINNVVHRLKKKERKQILIKEGKRIFVNPAINKMDFSQGIGLGITIKLPVNG